MITFELASSVFQDDKPHRVQVEADTYSANFIKKVMAKEKAGKEVDYSTMRMADRLCEHYKGIAYSIAGIPDDACTYWKIVEIA